MASKYNIDPNNPYAGLTKMASKVDKAEKEAADYGYAASVLPIKLREAFDKNRDPELDKAIITKQQEVLGGAITGLEKYRDISDPFTRRALAEKYQSGLTVGLDSLTSERDRRQGKFEDYITKWSGLYGAEAARKQQVATSAASGLSRYKTLADTAENQRRYNIAEAEKKRGSGTSASNKQTARLKEIEEDVRMGKYSRETAAFKIKQEFPGQDPNSIYKLVEDGYEKNPYYSKYFTPGKETSALDEQRNSNADIRDYYTYLLSVDEDQAKKYKEQYDWAF
jgi:hypothetical protein